MLTKQTRSFLTATLAFSLFTACANSDEIDTRLNTQESNPSAEIHGAFAIPQGITPFKADLAKPEQPGGDLLLLEIRSHIVNPKEQTTLKIAQNPSRRVAFRVSPFAGGLAGNSGEAVAIEWTEGANVQKFKATLPLEIELESNTIAPAAVVVSGPVLVQIYMWLERDDFLKIVIRTWPLFRLDSVNSLISGNDLFMTFRQIGSVFKSESYFIPKSPLLTTPKEFDSRKVKQQMSESTPILLKAL